MRAASADILQQSAIRISGLRARSRRFRATSALCRCIIAVQRSIYRTIRTAAVDRKPHARSYRSICRYAVTRSEYVERPQRRQLGARLRLGASCAWTSRRAVFYGIVERADRRAGARTPPT
ncbi:MAG: hypothetical protein ACLR4Z_06880 [Butyricicoccaceae bacterium]